MHYLIEKDFPWQAPSPANQIGLRGTSRVPNWYEKLFPGRDVNAKHTSETTSGVILPNLYSN